ncbi:MAG TPA: glycoside hydrolase family 38 C-terminal domain-containing protein [Clostridiaceae bacterium]
MDNTRKKLHFIAHVHWDPAWYLPLEQYRIILFKLMKKLLNILDTQEDFLSFMFDGQVSAIDDYLEISPKDKERIEKHIKSGRLIIGPWYIQPEEFMISGESHIRNLQLGSKRGVEMGGVMPVSYLCDMVGHIAQMPQIIKGFGIEYFVGWRGILDGKERNKSEFIWEGPDGSQVLVKVMVDSYNNLIPEDSAGFIKKVDEIKNSLEPFSSTDYLLIMAGGDHREPIESTSKLIKDYNAAVGYEQMEYTTLLHHMDTLKENWYKFKIHKGEFRAAFHPFSFILTGILTTRMEVKLQSEKVSMGIEKWMEPFGAINTILTGKEYPQEFLDYVWKKQLKNAFHDCIYGAHTDPVTLDIFNDYKRAMEIIEWESAESLYNISLNINTIGKDVNITLFNPTAWERVTSVVDFELFLKEGQIRKEFIIEDRDGNYLPVQVNSAKSISKYSEFSGNHWKQGEPEIGYQYSLSVMLPSLPALGYCNLGIKRGVFNTQDNREYVGIRSEILKQTDLKIGFNQLENKYLKVQIKENGLLNVYDKEMALWYENMNMLEDSGDAGDHYNFSYPLTNGIFTNYGEKAVVSLVENGPAKIMYKIQLDLNLPKSLKGNSARSDKLIKNRVNCYIVLRSNSKTIEFKMVIDNCSLDHRLRVVFLTGLNCEKSSSGSQFYVIDRSTTRPQVESFAEEPMGNYPHRLFVDISDEVKGITFMDRGLPEYEATPKGNLYITLLRSTGKLSKDCVQERSYCNAGPMYKTPLAQEIGTHTFEYALYFHKGDWKEGQSYRHCDEFYAKPKAIQGDAHDGDLSDYRSFLKLSGEGVVLSAFKKGYGEDLWIIRVYNVLNIEIQCSIQLLKPIKEAFYTDLNEKVINEISWEHDKIHFPIMPHKIITILVKL